VTARQRNARMKQMIEHERRTGMLEPRLVYFTDPHAPAGQRFLGACIVMAPGFITAIERAHQLGINPGGAVLHYDAPDHDPAMRDRLITSDEEMARNGNLTDLVEFALFTGLRRGEVLDLTWERVDRARGVILLDVTKSGKRREVPLNSRADAVLARRGSKSSGLVFGTRKWDHFRSAWERAVGRAKLVDFHFHDLRHTFASWAVQRGASLQEVKDLLGHRSLAMTLRYGHLAPEHLRSAVARLDTTLPTSDSAQASAQETRVEEALLSK
jgi:hypothetical protein